jgi:hypothetical protein
VAPATTTQGVEIAMLSAPLLTSGMESTRERETVEARVTKSRGMLMIGATSLFDPRKNNQRNRNNVDNGDSLDLISYNRTNTVYGRHQSAD